MEVPSAVFDRKWSGGKVLRSTCACGTENETTKRGYIDSDTVILIQTTNGIGHVFNWRAGTVCECVVQRARDRAAPSRSGAAGHLAQHSLLSDHWPGGSAAE